MLDADQIPSRVRYLADLIDDCEAAIDLSRLRHIEAEGKPASTALASEPGSREMLIAAMIQSDAVNGLRKAIEFMGKTKPSFRG